MNEINLRSMTKSILWRIIGIIVLAIVTFVFTRSLMETTSITFLHHFAFVFIYYFHERLWLKNNSIVGKLRTIMRVFTYEIILGFGILGFISLIVTGSWTKVTYITITYIGNKLWMYVAYDSVWSKMKWGLK